MPFVTDQAYAARVPSGYGTYHSTFRSETNQVEAQLFERNGWLVAYISFPGGLKLADVSDPWIDELHSYACDHGFNGKLAVKYTV